MDAELIFAEDVEVCPKCGSSEFWENRIIWVGDDPADEELASIECKGCGATYYARSYYRRRFGKPEDDEEIPFQRKELEMGFWLGLLIGLLIGFFLCAALMAWHALTYDFIDGEWKRREG